MIQWARSFRSTMVNGDTLEPVTDVSNGGLIAVAAWIGSTRLIDNVVLHGVGTAKGPNLSSS